jgi:ornithine--oxo-acid transaminase
VWLAQALRDASLPQVAEIRGRGLWIGIDLVPDAGTARAACERLMERGILAKDTHDSTIRLAPPLCVTREDLEWALERILHVLSTAAR